MYTFCQFLFYLQHLYDTITLLQVNFLFIIETFRKGHSFYVCGLLLFKDLRNHFLSSLLTDIVVCLQFEQDALADGRIWEKCKRRGEKLTKVAESVTK